MVIAAHDRVRVWLALTYQPAEQLLRLARAAQDVGFDGVTVAEHLVTPASISSRYPYSADGALDVSPELAAPDPLVTAAALAAVTDRLLVATTVYLLPLHELFSAAKAISTVACLSANRLVLGVGVGWMSEEFNLAGQRFEHRGARTDEMLQILAKLFTGSMTEHHGAFYDFDPVQIAPVPTSPVPVLVGGESDAALERAARADGWIGARSYGLDDLAIMIQRLSQAQARVGPPPRRPLVMTSLEADPDTTTRKVLEDMGVTDVVVRAGRALGSRRAGIDERLRSLDDYARKVLTPA